MTIDNGSAIVSPASLHHVRLTVTDIGRSKPFYERLFGAAPIADFSHEADQPGVREDPEKLYGGCAFAVGDQLLGLRPVASTGDRFDSTRVGLDHLSMQLSSLEELQAAQQRLGEAGIEHGELKELADLGIAIVSLQDPDDINLELTAALSS